MKKPIKNYNGVYSITSNGEVIKEEREVLHKTKKGQHTRLFPEKKMAVSRANNGYMKIALTHPRTGIATNYNVARLVAEHFIDDNLDILQLVFHKDGNKKNNNVDNLGIISKEQGYANAYQLGLKDGKVLRG